MDDELYSKQFTIEHKKFYVDLKANSNGQYLKISEKSGGRRHNVLVPITGLEDLADAIDEALEVAEAQGVLPVQSDVDATEEEGQPEPAIAGDYNS